jgi:tetratricopeptide (TPR) repeat protein
MNNIIPIADSKFLAMSLYRLASAIDETDPVSAIELYEKALVHDPRLAIAFVNCGNCYYRTGNSEKARLYYDRALMRDPCCPEAHCNLGFLLLDSGRAEDSVPYLKAAVKLDPDFADAHYNLAIAYQRTGQYALAKFYRESYDSLNNKQLAL